MKFEIELYPPPNGFVMNAVKAGEKAMVSIRGFISTEDGDAFVAMLEELPNQILIKLQSSIIIYPSQVDSLIAVISRDGSTTVYINQPYTQKIRAKTSLQAGQTVSDDDIAEIQSIEFPDVVFPPDCGVIILFSKGWRKGFYYDFAPITLPLFEKRDYELSSLLGHFFSYLSYQHLFKLTDKNWLDLFEQRWFPFVGLKTDTVKSIVTYAKLKWNVDDLIDLVAEEVKQLAPTLLERWRKHNYFKDHEILFESAIERFLSKDYVSSTAIIYPRIEGLLRSIMAYSGNNTSINQKHLIKAAAGSSSNPYIQFSKLLPERFKEFIEKVYFASFSPGDPTEVSRNSVAHGVAKAESFSQKSATLGLLILDQMFYYQPPPIESNQ